MNNDPSAELAELKKEVATLKEQMADLRKFIHVHTSSKAPHAQSMSIQCSTLEICREMKANTPYASFCATEDGAYLNFVADDKKARIILKLKDKNPSLDFFNDGLKHAASIGLDQNDRAYMAVYDHGKPRAGIKADEKGGVVSVTHDDGVAHGAFYAGSDHAGLGLKNADMKTVVSITSKTPGSGGIIQVNNSEGKPGVLIAGTQESGIVSVHAPGGQIIDQMPGKSSS